MNRVHCLPGLAVFALAALGSAYTAVAAAEGLKAGPRNTIRIETAPQHEAQLASLSVDPADLARGATDATSRRCAHRAGPRNTIRTCD